LVRDNALTYVRLACRSGGLALNLFPNDAIATAETVKDSWVPGLLELYSGRRYSKYPLEKSRSWGTRT
jgi:hypothetical protein